MNSEGNEKIVKIYDQLPLNLYTNYEQAATNFPNTAIIVDEEMQAFPELGKETTYAASLVSIKKRAAQLATLGVRQGDHVLIYKRPAFDTYLLAVAVSYLGAVPVMVSYHLPTTTIAIFIERLDQPYILYDEVTAQRVAAVNRQEYQKNKTISAVIASEETLIEQVNLPQTAISYITHTSGTTGVPKLICHSAESMGWRTAWQKSVLSEMTEIKLVGFHISPVHSRFNIGISSLMTFGFPLLALANAQIESVAEMLANYQPIALETHPNHFVQWAQLALEKPELFQQTRYFHSTFDAINNGTMRSFLQASQAEQPVFLQVYGQSECGPMILKAHTLVSLKHSDARNMGKGLKPFTSARICNERGDVLPANTDGFIQFLSKGRALTYYQEDARFQQATYGEWWDSGDYGYMDEQGQVYLKDRQVDLIETIDSTLALEDYLLDQLSFLAEVIIVRGTDDRPQPIIALLSQAEMDWNAWWEKVSDLPYLHKPLILPFAEIPRTATMKVQRLMLEKALKK